MKLAVFLSLSLLVTHSFSTADDLSTKASSHHKNLQSENEGIIFGRIEDGKTSYGFAGKLGKGRPAIDEHTLFEIGSITKTFTGVLLADQVLRGNAKLDDPITNYLPDSVTKDADVLSSITLLNLATHTSGLPRLPSNLEKGADSTNPYAHYSTESLYDYLESFTSEEFEEQGKMSYSNLGMGLLGHLLELISGRSYEELMAEVILDPLSMDETYLQRNTDSIPETARERFAQGHRTGKPVSHWQIDALSGAGAIVSSASDMLKYARAYWSADTPAALRQAMEMAARPQGESMGLGWFLSNSSISHDGGTGGFVSSLSINPSEETAQIRLENSSATSVIESISGDFSSIEGDWQGTLKTPIGDLPQVLRITKEGHCRLYSVKQGGFGIPAGQATFEDGKLTCRFPSIGGSFTGRLSNRSLEGEWQQSSTLPLTLTRSDGIPPRLVTALSRKAKGDFSELSGYWSGYLGGKAGLFLVVQFIPIETTADVSLYSPDQTNDPLPVSSIEFDGEKLQLESKSLKAKFNASLQGRSLKGWWNQGVPIPLSLEWSKDRPKRE